MSFVTWILAGALLGGAASALIGIRDWKGLALNVVIGVAGVLCGGWLLGVLIGASAFNSGDFGLSRLLVSLLGTSVLLAVLQLSRGIVASKPRTLPDEASAAFEKSRVENHNQSEIFTPCTEVSDGSGSRLPVRGSASDSPRMRVPTTEPPSRLARRQSGTDRLRVDRGVATGFAGAPTRPDTIDTASAMRRVT